MIRPVNKNDAARIASLYAPFVTNSAISFELTAPSADEMAERIHEYTKKYPWYVWEEDGNVVGYAYASSYRSREAYQWNAEVSVYIDPTYSRRGIARKLYKKLFSDLDHMGIVNIYAVITQPNEPSVHFHESCGFKYLTTYKHVGYKLGHWHDVGWWVRTAPALPTPPKTPQWTAGSN